MTKIRKLVKDIDRGVNLKKDLPVYGEMLSDTYLNYAAIELTFSACILSESILEYEEMSEEEERMYDEVMALLRQVLSDDLEKHKSAVETAKDIRSRITSITDIFTSYTDRLICYEYVLKRMQLKFSKDPEVLEMLASVDEEQMIKKILLYAVGEEDQSIVRERLQTLMGIIPVRMTKNKFLERIEQTIGLYKGSDKESLDSFIFMLRSAAMLHRPDDGKFFNERIREFLIRLEKTDFVSMDEETYTVLSGELEEISTTIYHITDFYYSLQKVVNGICALCLCRIHNRQVSDVFASCMDILQAIADKKYEEESMVKLEGKIEEYVERSSYLEAVLFEVKTSYRGELEELGLLTEFEDYAVVANLLSDSLFIDIDRVQDDVVVDAAMVKEVSGELEKELSELLGSLSKPVKRAVMASVLGKLPVTFTQVDEVESYIRTNLFGCQDFSEKGMALLELMEEME